MGLIQTIGFTFYGNPDSKLAKERKYFQGIIDNLKLIPELYPGWVLRLYYDLKPDHPLMKDLCSLACEDANIDLCYVRDIPAAGDVSKVFAMNWRFLPCLDDQVGIKIYIKLCGVRMLEEEQRPRLAERLVGMNSTSTLMIPSQ